MRNNGRWHLGPFIYVWLAISVLLNFSGMASIVDGFVVWAGFLREFVDLYRAWIREPISWAVHLVWPSWWPKIPGWVFDWLCVSGSFLLALKFIYFGRYRITLYSYFRDDFLGSAFQFGLFLLFGPLLLLIILFIRLILGHGHETDWVAVGNTFFFWALIIATFVFLMFLNWQLKRAGVW